MALRRWIASVVIASALGCNAIAGIHDPVDAPAVTNQPDPLDRFVGTWTSASPVQTLSNCPAAGPVPSASTSVIIERTGGTETSFTITPVVNPNCHIDATVSGEVLTASDGQMCVFGARQTYTYSSASTFELLNVGGTSAKAHIVAQLVFQPSGERCTFDEESTYTKQ